MVCVRLCNVGYAFNRFYSGLIYDSMLVLIIGSMIGFLMFNLESIWKKRGVFLR
jgi:hypothetical protein